MRELLAFLPYAVRTAMRARMRSILTLLGAALAMALFAFVRTVDDGVGRRFSRGEELGRFNMGSTVIVLTGRAVEFAPRVEPGEPVCMGQLLARFPA